MLLYERVENAGKVRKTKQNAYSTSHVCFKVHFHSTPKIILPVEAFVNNNNNKKE